MQLMEIEIVVYSSRRNHVFTWDGHEMKRENSGEMKEVKLCLIREMLSYMKEFGYM